MNKRNMGEFCWSELATPNMKASKDFYGELLGWNFTDHTKGEMTYTMITSQNEQFAGMWQIPTAQQDKIPPHWMGYILVDDLEGTLEKATQLGATVRMPITQVGEMGRFIIVADPTGAHIAFWQTLNK